MKKGIIGNPKKMEEYYQFCQLNYKKNPELWGDMFILAKEALYSCMTKKTKSKNIILEDWEDRLSEGVVLFMTRYKKNPNYKIKYLFKTMHYQMLNMLYNQKKYREVSCDFSELPLSLLGVASFENELLDKLEKEGY